MVNRADLEEWVLASVRERGNASVLDVAKDIWAGHAAELESSGDLFYTWQYDMRWAADRLRKAGKLRLAGRKWALAR
jgi:hypothetical protein